MSKGVAIDISGVSKSFKLPHEKTTSIKGAVLNFYKPSSSHEIQQALSDISFQVNEGDFFGIVGRNGSGKSTLLKILAGIYTPSSGSVETQGKLTPFIELGVGFSPELSGRENVFLNGALLGFTRSEMELIYDDIVSFAELERFMDQKLKNYSSGMQVRLAFSIAIQVKSDILILDEVLAVGDEAFQRKCIKIFDEYKNNKQTIVLVTHDMETVKKYCNRAVLINDGNLIEQGDPHEIANMYSKLNQVGAEPAETLSKPGELGIKLKKSKLNTRRYAFGETLEVSLHWPASKKVKVAGVAIYSSIGEKVYATNTGIDEFSVKGTGTKYSVKLTLGGGEYYVMAGIWNKDMDVIDFVARGPEFTVEDDDTQIGEGLVRLEHSWDTK